MDTKHITPKATPGWKWLAIAAICLGAWGGLVGFESSAASDQTQATTEDKLADEAHRQKIFAQAMNRVADIDATEAAIWEARREGKDLTLLKSTLKMLQDAHERNQPFTRKFYNLNEEQLEAIINEGLAEEWPYS